MNITAGDWGNPPLPRPLAGGNRQSGACAMAYGLQTTSLALETGEPYRGGQRPSTAIRRWRALDAERRLAIIEASLAGHGVTDGYPLAL
jgi:hypothetical protein